MLLTLAWDNRALAPEGWGSHVIVHWRDFEPQAGVYRLELFTQELERRVRPCYVQLGFSFLDKAKNVPIDYTPRQHKHSLRLSSNGVIGEIPPYDGAWCDAYSQAVEALAYGLREHPQVVGYWHAAGWNTETQAAVSIRGNTWATAARAVLSAANYYAFLTESTRRAVAAWGDVPVYLPGAPSPGEVWGTKRRDLIADCLRDGAGYLNCGLRVDNDTSMGIGEREGLGMYDIAELTPRRGFEEGPRAAADEPMELYWMLLRARHWQADFVNLYSSLSAPDVAAVQDLLPATDARWIVFRDAEYPAQAWVGGGKTYGFSGEPGNWGCGITTTDAGTPTRGDGFGFDRWTLNVGMLTLSLPGAPDGLYQVTIWRPDGTREISIRLVAAERLMLPAGLYHRVDVSERVLTVEERVAELERRVQVLEKGG